MNARNQYKFRKQTNEWRKGLWIYSFENAYFLQLFNYKVCMYLLGWVMSKVSKTSIGQPCRTCSGNECNKSIQISNSANKWRNLGENEKFLAHFDPQLIIFLQPLHYCPWCIEKTRCLEKRFHALPSQEIPVSPHQPTTVAVTVTRHLVWCVHDGRYAETCAD